MELGWDGGDLSQTRPTAIPSNEEDIMFVWMIHRVAHKIRNQRIHFIFKCLAWTMYFLESEYKKCEVDKDYKNSPWISKSDKWVVERFIFGG